MDPFPLVYHFIILFIRFGPKWSDWVYKKKPREKEYMKLILSPPSTTKNIFTNIILSLILPLKSFLLIFSFMSYKKKTKLSFVDFLFFYY